MGFIKYLSDYTLKQYKECYSDLLERHKLEYDDHNEFTFINSELESYWDKFIDIENIEEVDFQYKFATGNADEEFRKTLADNEKFRAIAIKSNLSCSLIIDFLETRKQELEEVSNIAIPQQHETIKNDRTSQLHPKYDPNLWNKNCFELFKYLYDCYYKNTNRQLTNIWFFLKYNVCDTYVLKATKDEYGAFILKNYSKKISNFDKAQDKWSEKELPTLQEHRINFEENLKEITKHLKNT